jgi:hypothetical protein
MLHLSHSYALEVKQGEVTGTQYAGKEEIRVISDDIRFIKISGNDIRQKPEYYYIRQVSGQQY